MEQSALETFRASIGDCRRCPLAEGRTSLVFGTGNPHARVMLIGEAPGRNEDKSGEPFVGAAGRFLNELLACAGLRREDVYIANILKCRPPENRDPKLEEIECCTPYLREQIKLIRPDYLVTLGNFASRFILKTEQGISLLHGQRFDAGAFTVMPMFHPAAAIYDRKKRELLQADFAALGRLLDEKYPRLGSDAGNNAADASAADASAAAPATMSEQEE